MRQIISAIAGTVLELPNGWDGNALKSLAFGLSV